MTIATKLLDTIFPPQCPNCSDIVDTHNTVCITCWNKIAFITDPYCNCCGKPFGFDSGQESLCGDCIKDRPPYATARSIFRYDEHSRNMILKLKYADQTQLAPMLGRWLSTHGGELLTQCDVVIPVPLHYWRFVSRRYNQSALLAQAIAHYAELPLLLDGLLRVRATQAQAGLTRAQRKTNLRGAFKANPNHQESLKAKSVLLIDDVITTGSTLNYCSKALLAAGAQNIHVLTLARTVA